MSRATTRYGFAFSLLAGACAAPPPSSERTDETIVLTKYAEGVDFGDYATYHVRPDVLTTSADGGIEPLDPDDSAALVNATKSNLEKRGFDETPDPDQADIGVQLLYMDQINTSYWCYSWWDPYYWGYPYWGYYPYYGGCSTTVWKSGMLATVIVDLKAAREEGVGPGPGPGEGGASGGGGLFQVAGIWFSGVYGVSLTSKEARDGINQAFKQSPYIKAQ
jgi:hypothetical protein